jgi:hypothetical protein
MKQLAVVHRLATASVQHVHPSPSTTIRALAEQQPAEVRQGVMSATA